jgi:hypothetical protein
MKKPREPSTEVICPACEGTGFQKVKQPTQPGRKLYPPKMRGMSRQGPNKETRRDVSWTKLSACQMIFDVTGDLFTHGC